jgi:hypothetical protein
MGRTPYKIILEKQEEQNEKHEQQSKRQVMKFTGENATTKTIPEEVLTRAREGGVENHS